MILHSEMPSEESSAIARCLIQRLIELMSSGVLGEVSTSIQRKSFSALRRGARSIDFF
jgi:hypothetical protein